MVPCMKYCECPSWPRSKGTKGPHDTVHIPLVASGSALARPSLTLWNHSLHQGASAYGPSEERKDDASVGCDLHFASHSWLSACSWLAEQISGSDLWPAASVLMRMSGISHITHTSSPLPGKGQIVATVPWHTMGKPQSFAFTRSGAGRGTKNEWERLNSCFIFLSVERQGCVKNQHRRLSASSPVTQAQSA